MKKTFLILAASVAATIAGFSQAPTEKNVAKDADLRGLQTVSLSLKNADHTPAEFRILFMRILSENRNDLIFRLAVHELNLGASPYVIGIMKKSATDFIMVSIPKGMIDKGWEKIESAPKTDFATKWGVEIPNPPTARTGQMNVTRKIGRAHV